MDQSSVMLNGMGEMRKETNGKENNIAQMKQIVNVFWCDDHVDGNDDWF